MTYTTPRRADAEDPATIPTVADLLRADTGTPRPTLFERSVRDYPEEAHVSADLFTSPDVARREAERLWPRVWQMACLEQDVPAPGDFCEYVVGQLSVLVVRGTDRRVRAFHNACRHRGNRLKVGAGHAGTLELRCPFHAWAWELDGCLKEIPCRWDFPQVVDEEYGLAELACETWKGFVFVNPGPDAVPLSDWLGPDILRQFDAWPLESRWKAAHVARRVPCNWKLAHQAFMESYHVFRTHPATIRYVADVCAQNDAYGLHGRFVTPTGVPSPHLREPVTDQEIVDAMIGDAVADLFGGADHSDIVPKVPDGATARVVLAQFLRATLGARLGVDLGGASDSEMLDVVGFPIFPNIVIMVGEELPIIYRFRPEGDDPDACLFEVMVHLPVPPGADRPPAAPVHRLPDGGRFADAAELGGLGKIFDEDMSNLERIQLGVKSPGFAGPSFSREQEVLIRQFHHNLARYLA